MTTKLKLIRGLLVAVAMVLAPGMPLPSASAQVQGEVTTLSLTANEVEYTVGVLVPTGWSVAPETFKNARSLVKDARRGAADLPAEVQIYVEPRLDHDDALNQIRELTSFVSDEARFVTEIAGWPAVQIEQHETRPQPSQGTPYSEPEVLRIMTYIAVRDTLFVVTGTLPPDARDELVDTVLDITASLDLGGASDLEQLRQDLDLLETSIGPDQGAAPEPRAARTGRGAIAGLSVTAGAETGAVIDPNIRIDAAGRGELEVAVSPDGLDVVIALQSRRFVSSNNGGISFPNSGQPGAGNGDPSIAQGQSGDFYLAWIDTGCGTAYTTFNVGTLPAQTFGYDCTGMARSTDNGVTFQSNTVNPAVVCIGQAPAGGVDPAGACFPDQEHIAADRVTAGAGGGDQVYSTWRNFNSANQDAGLVCSQDSGVNWTAPITLGANSFFPRITVGQDGFVYVAADGGGNYRLWKYSSCANGLNLQAGFPVNVATRTPYVCPFAGHDRCDQNPSSQTVAVDDTNPNHVYYAFAQDDAEAVNSYSTVFVRDSTDGGLTWPAARVVQANSAVNARRVMPWLCTTQGDAVVTWYEQAAPVPSDSTHHVGAQVGLDNANNLTSKAEFTISEVPDNWCDSGWACGTRVAPGASETCPIQPQLAGFCGDGNAATADSNIRCDFSDEAATPGTYCPQPGPSGNNETCLAGNGCPKYGDYNGNACMGGRLHAAWPSADSPMGVPGPSTATNTGVLYSFVAVNGPPVCDANGPYVAECGVSTALDGSASVDPEGQLPLTFTWTGPFAESPTSGSTPAATFPAPTGLKSVGLLVEDPDGLGESCTAQVTVQDTIAPGVTAPDDVEQECSSPAGTPVDIGTATADDICDPSVGIANDAPALFPLGDTTVTWTATDADGNQGMDTQTVTIVDTIPPDFELVLTPNELWPPNHKLVSIEADIQMLTDVCDAAPAVRLVSITSNEPDDGLGDGDTAGDVQGADFGQDDRTFLLRAERSGRGDGRAYTITYVAEDASGNETSKQATVTVPKSRSGQS